MTTLAENKKMAGDLMLPESTETGKLNVMHLKRYWSKIQAKRNGALQQDAFTDEWTRDVTLLSILGLGIEQTLIYVYRENPDFDQLEDWVLDINNGSISSEKIKIYNDGISGVLKDKDTQVPTVLSDADISFWNENGYIILRNAVPKEDCDKTIALICDHLGIVRNDPSTWYRNHRDRQGIMIQLFQHQQLQKNRDTAIIKQSYQQLWGRTDILVNTDRVGFNPPETDNYKFPGPKLHWDVSLELPISFGLQGILYLADTAANQGAFTLVPGFQNRIDEWIHSLPADTDARTQDIYALGAMPIAANAGDFIIWHQALPHGSSPNNAALPRYVQYINYQPADPDIRKNWK